MPRESNDDESKNTIELPVSKEDDDTKLRKIFINNVDSYQGQAICEAIQTTNDSFSHSTFYYEITGTIQNEKLDFDNNKQYVKNIINRKDPSYKEYVTNSDFIIYDICSRDKSILKEIQEILNYLTNKFKNLKNEINDISELEVKYFVLISTPLTWVQTKPIKDNPNCIFLEENYRKRRAHPMYIEHQYVERITISIQKQCKPYLKTIVICPGITYGGCNDVFHYIFKRAYFNQDIEVFQPGDQCIPVIYIKDFARIIKQVIEDFPKSSYRYLFAVQPNFITAKKFARIIAEHIMGNPFKVKIIPKIDVFLADPDTITEYVYDCININLKLMPAYFKDFQFTINFEKFEDILILAQEYRFCKNLSPIKIIIDGPPFSGKTILAKKLADYYKINYLNGDNIINEAAEMLQKDISEGEEFLKNLQSEKSTKPNNDNNEEEQNEHDNDIIQLESDIQERINNWAKEMSQIHNLLSNFDKGSEKSNYDNVMSSSEDFIKKKFIYKILLSKSYNENHGYVMDGCPFLYQQLEQIFGKPIYTESDEKENEFEENYDERDDEIESENKFIPKPKHVIILEIPNELVCNRAMELPEFEAIRTHNTEEEFMKKLNIYCERNQEDTSVSNYFIDNDIVPITITINEKTTNENIFENILKIIGFPHVYPLTKFEIETLAKEEKKKMLLKEAEKQKQKEEIAQKEKEKREENLQKWTEQYERLKTEEQEILEARSLPLQQYLAKFVLPTLTDGLLKVAEVKPDDPFDFLAEYLFQCNPNGNILEDPSYDEEKKRLLLTFSDLENSEIVLSEHRSENENELCKTENKLKSDLNDETKSKNNLDNKNQPYWQKRRIEKIPEKSSSEGSEEKPTIRRKNRNKKNT